MTLGFAFDPSSDGLLTAFRRADKPVANDATLPAELSDGRVAWSGAIVSCHERRTSIDSGRRYARQLAAGDCRLGKFELQAELGAGSFGHVFRARDTELDRTVAVKIQRAGSLADDEEASRFLREARSVAQLKHPGIVSLYEIGQTDEGVCFLVTEFIDGQTLEDRLKSGLPDPRWTAETAGPGGRGLAVCP